MSIYPNAVADDTELLPAFNNLATTLNGNLNSTGDNTGGNGIALASTINFPASGVVTIENEVIRYTSIAGNNLMGYTRGYDSTQNTTHASGAAVSLEFVAAHHNVLKDEINATEDDLINGIRLNAYPNLLINPGLECWSNLTTILNPPSDALYLADRWVANYTNTPTFTINRSTVVNLGNYSLESQITATGGATTFSIRQYIENYKDHLGKIVSLSVWVNSSVPGIKAFISNGTPATSLSAAHVGGSTWQRLSCTYTVPGGSTQLIIGVGFLDISPNLSDIFVDSAMLVNGSKPMDYQPFTTAADVDRCLRYYERQSNLRWRFYASSTSPYYLPIHFASRKALATPVVNVAAGTGNLNVASVSSDSPNANGFNLVVTPSIIGEVLLGGNADASWEAIS
jgi:hypothetical protein